MCDVKNDLLFQQATCLKIVKPAQSLSKDRASKFIKVGLFWNVELQLV